MARRSSSATRARTAVTYLIIFSGFFEPLFYLLSMGVGLGHFVGDVPGPNGELVSYASFIAPALLATAAMNGAMYDASSIFWKMKYMKLYDSVLATPLGPIDVAVGELCGRCSAACSTPSRS